MVVSGSSATSVAVCLQPQATCCGGTGLENHTKYQETIYLKSADGTALWVNLYAASTLTWAEKGFTVTQQTTYPRADSTRLAIDGTGRLDLKLRVPGWVRKGFFVTVNGVAETVKVTGTAAGAPGDHPAGGAVRCEQLRLTT